MRSRENPRVLAALFALAFAPAAPAQSFNLDVGGNGVFPTPSPAYGAGAGQPGHWNAISGTSTGLTLHDLGGNATAAQAATVTSFPSVGNFNWNHPATSGDDELLMDDAQDAAVLATWTFSGLFRGNYTVYTYAWAPDDPTVITTIDVAGSTDLPQNAGGAWPGGQVLGLTYTRHAVHLPVGGILTITATSGSGFGAVNGFQLVLEPVGFPYCSGDGLDPLVTTDCPCGNFGAPERGCANSAQAAGARLAATGSTSPDTVVLRGSGMPASVSCIYLKGSADNVTGVVFGDGVRCADGSLIRLRTKQNAGGASQYPEPGDPLVSVRGQTPPGSGLTGYYQTYYRNAAAVFCPPATFNVTNGWVITW